MVAHIATGNYANSRANSGFFTNKNYKHTRDKTVAADRHKIRLIKIPNRTERVSRVKCKPHTLSAQLPNLLLLRVRFQVRIFN